MRMLAAAIERRRAVKINLFAGGRRIALLLGGLWALGCLAFAVFTEPYVRDVTYVIPKPSDAPVLTEKCDGETADILRKGPTGDSINVRLCFPFLTDESYIPPPSSAFDSKRYIPVINRSLEIAAYKRDADRLLPLDQTIKVAEAKERAALLAQWKDAMFSLFGGLAIGWAVVAAIGWIARGFIGIPMGKDIRISE
jgi:hypothetical protein